MQQVTDGPHLMRPRMANAARARRMGSRNREAISTYVPVVVRSSLLGTEHHGVERDV
jgi:hypothetical protein